MKNSINAAEISSVEARHSLPQSRAMATRTSSRTRRQPADTEPSLSELIADPVLHAMMARDGIGCADLVGAIDVARARLGLGPWREAPCGPGADNAMPLAACCG
jgi:hypothetical protein